MSEAIDTEPSFLTAMVDGEWLDAQHFPPLAWSVQGIVPEGFGLIVAPRRPGSHGSSPASDWPVPPADSHSGRLALNAVQFCTWHSRTATEGYKADSARSLARINLSRGTST